MAAVLASQGPRVLVLGGRGFVGRHAVAALAEVGAEVVVGSREARPGALPVRLEQSLLAEDWHDLIADYDAVLNCVGILRQVRGATYDRVHRRAPIALAQACASVGKRFVHVSALGLHDGAGSRFLTSKLAGERGIREVDGDWIIARPSLLDGVGGYGARWLRGVSRLPFFFVPIDARGQIAALRVEDLGMALARLCLADANVLRLSQSREFELGGNRRWVFADYIAHLRKSYTERPPRPLPVPGFAARGFAHLCDLLHFTPFSYGHWELLRQNNVPDPNRLEELIGRSPSEVGERMDAELN